MAAESDARQRRSEDFKGKWASSERKRTRLQSDFDNQSADMEMLRKEKDRLVADVERLNLKNSQTESRLKLPESSALEKDKQLLILGREKDDALQLLKNRDEEVEALKAELEALKSASHKENIITDFKASAEYKAALRKETVPYLDKGIVHVIRQLHPFVPNKRLLVEVDNYTKV